MHPCKLQKMQSRETVTFRSDDMRVPAPQSPLPHRRRGNKQIPEILTASVVEQHVPQLFSFVEPEP
jgi:hypothetical protein